VDVPHQDVDFGKKPSFSDQYFEAIPTSAFDMSVAGIGLKNHREDRQSFRYNQSY
jgi:hypothetical protein